MHARRLVQTEINQTPGKQKRGEEDKVIRDQQRSDQREILLIPLQSLQSMNYINILTWPMVAEEIQEASVTYQKRSDHVLKKSHLALLSMTD
jgi:hypothetical protein